MIEVAKKKKIQASTRRYTIEAYFELEEKSLHKNEFINGKIRPMAGGTLNHNMLSGTIHALLFMLFFNTEKVISIHNSDQKVYIPDFNKFTYTDTFVINGQTETYKDGNQAILNPTLIVEVASKSTEAHDRTTKFRMYKSLPSFKEYVIVNQDMPIVEVFSKINDKQWKVTSYIGFDEVVQFETIDATLKMSDIYKKAQDLKDPQLDIDFLDKEEL